MNLQMHSNAQRIPRFVDPGHIHEIAKLTNAVESTSGETMYLLVMSTMHTHGITYDDIHTGVFYKL